MISISENALLINIDDTVLALSEEEVYELWEKLGAVICKELSYTQLLNQVVKLDIKNKDLERENKRLKLSLITEGRCLSY